MGLTDIARGLGCQRFYWVFESGRARWHLLFGGAAERGGGQWLSNAGKQLSPEASLRWLRRLQIRQSQVDGAGSNSGMPRVRMNWPTRWPL